MSGPFDDMGVAENRGTPKSFILIGFSIMNHPFWGIPIFGNTHMFLVPYFLENGWGQNGYIFPLLRVAGC